MTTQPISLINAQAKIKVSSTLDKSVGRKCLTDGSPETCWTSQQGLPQYIQASFPSPALPKRVILTFQGGFAGTRCCLDVQYPGSPEWHTWTRIYPEDVNRKQSFDLEAENQPVATLRLVFEESSDFFGRITVYDLQIEGTWVS
ncbi:hypothetical protein FA95DRAFT_1579279 [Auriscalpium vulgare]|uniref:Uncharacterized protein n=1 Tax=Auriscalpium vulgare TaxID=40419 RepID=A0ACB8SCJ1_9AGAM|nr:hypothetical protein FA95DRAFT_1579279 [Auriscalpium vulgare]